MLSHQLSRSLIGALLLLATGCGGGADKDATLAAAVDAWHAEREDRLRDATGWLTLVGLHPLAAGASSVGSDAAAAVPLIAKAPPHVGVLTVTADGISFTADAAVEVYLADAEPAVRVATVDLASDRDGDPTRLRCGSLDFHVIDRAGNLYLRVKDRESPLLAEFTGVDRYPVLPRWRVIARLEAAPTMLTVPNALGQETEEASPGVLVFELAGREQRLTPTGDPQSGLFIVFGDATNGQGTYPGGRFLSTAAIGALGTVVLDFNRAVNPPCAFTPYATCPLPAAGNVLPLAVTAGEKVWRTGH